MDWKANVDLFEQLRREHEFGIGTIAGVAAKFGVHRRVVRRALAGALPPPHRYPERSKPKLGAVQAFIERVLFGAFGVKQRSARTMRNPRTGKAVPVDAKTVLFFKAGMKLRRRLNRPTVSTKPT